MPFLEGTVPPADNVHTKGCFDIVQEVRQDDRRPQEWIDSAALWADRLVNGQTGSVGDPTELKENPDYRLAIAPVLGNSSYGQPICGELRATPKPSRTPRGSADPSDPGSSNCPPGNPEKCSPLPSLPPGSRRDGAGLRSSGHRAGLRAVAPCLARPAGSPTRAPPPAALSTAQVHSRS